MSDRERIVEILKKTGMDNYFKVADALIQNGVCFCDNQEDDK